MKMATRPRAPAETSNAVCPLPKREDICVWMIAGVVNFKLCNHAPGCPTCPFDEAMRKAWNHKRREERP